MTVDLDWLALQPGEGVEEGKVAAAGETLSTDAPATPLAHQEGRLRLLGGTLSEIEPASPRETAAGGGPSFTAAAGSSRAAAGEPEGGGGSRWLAAREEGAEEEQLVMQKHLAFNSPQAERDFRLHLGRCNWLGELGLLGLQFIAWLAAAGRAAEVACLAVVARITLLVLAPSILHIYLLLYAPAAYRRHRELLSLALRVPFDCWVVATQDAPELGIGGPVVHRGIPPPCKLLLMMIFQFVMAPLVACQPFVHSYAYSTALLALWLGRHMRHASGWLLAALLVLYAGPLVTLFRKEVQDRCTFAARRAAERRGGPAGQAEQDAASPVGSPRASAAASASSSGFDVAKLRARIDAEPWAPAEFLLPAMLGACSACL